MACPSRSHAGPSSPLYPRALLAAGSLGVLIACSDAATIIDERAPLPGTEEVSTAAASPNEAPDEPLYAVLTRFFSDEGQTAYVALSPDLDEGMLSLDTALEFPGGAYVGGLAGERTFYVGMFAGPTVEKWRVNDAGELELAGSLSFANLGVTRGLGAAAGVFVSPTRAYFVDITAGGELVIWDPDAMQIVGSVPIPAEYLDYSGDGNFVRRGVLVSELHGERLLLSVNWADPENDGTRWARFSTHFTFDLETQTFSEPFDEARNAYPQPRGIKGEDGTIYYSPLTRFVLPGLVFGEDFGLQSTGLHVVPPGSRFDEGYDVDLSALVGGRPAGNVIPVSNDLAFLLVWHPELVPEITPENWSDSFSAEGYRWWTWRIGDDLARDNVVQQPAIGRVNELVVDGKVFSVDGDPDAGISRLVQLSPDGTLRPGLSIGGELSRVVRLR